MKKLISKIRGLFKSEPLDMTGRCGGCLFSNHTKTYCWKKHRQICYWDKRCAEYREER